MAGRLTFGGPLAALDAQVELDGRAPPAVAERWLRAPRLARSGLGTTRGVASPTQLRAFMKRDPRDLLGEFRALAPPRQPIALQRWGARRVVLAAAMLGAIAIAADVSISAFKPAGAIGVHPPACVTGDSMILSAQAVPSSATLPCIAAPPSGWTHPECGRFLAAADGLGPDSRGHIY